MPGPIVVIFLLFSACDSRLPLWRRCGPGGAAGALCAPPSRRGPSAPACLGLAWGHWPQAKRRPPGALAFFAASWLAVIPWLGLSYRIPTTGVWSPCPAKGAAAFIGLGLGPGPINWAGCRAQPGGGWATPTRRRPPRKAGYIHAALLRAQSREDPLTFWLILLEWYMRPRRSFGTFPLTSVYLLASACRETRLCVRHTPGLGHVAAKGGEYRESQGSPGTATWPVF